MAKKVLTAIQVKKLDLKAREKFGIPALLLMENAGRAISDEVLKIIAGRKVKVAIFCGKGNNGGDGFCAARHLFTKGINADIYLCGNANWVKGEAKTNLDILLKLKRNIFEINQDNLKRVKRRISRYSLVIDALLGVGLKGEVTGIIAEIIKMINAAKAYVLSVDIPSGLDATTGKILGVSVEADKTVTFVSKKMGMVKGQGKGFCGETIVIDIGLPLRP